MLSDPGAEVTNFSQLFQRGDDMTYIKPEVTILGQAVCLMESIYNKGRRELRDPCSSPTAGSGL
jgi:hypothetical protein